MNSTVSSSIILRTSGSTLSLSSSSGGQDRADVSDMTVRAADARMARSSAAPHAARGARRPAFRRPWQFPPHWRHPRSPAHPAADICRHRAPGTWHSPASCVSMVRRPITGTSKRISWFGFATFTTVNSRPSVEGFSPSDGEVSNSPARRIVASVPSIASTAMQAASAITTVCPISKRARCCATARP